MTWKNLRGEIEAHIEERALGLIESGMSESDAWAQARREFGNATQITESSREAWGWMWLERLGQDLRYAFRTMAANRLFTLLAVSTLALGIGANTAIYSFMDAILLRSLPVPDPDSLAVLNWQIKITGDSKGKRRPTVMRSMSGTNYAEPGAVTGAIFPYPAFELLQKQDSLFSSLFAFYPAGDTNVMVKGQAERGTLEYVTGDYFRGLGVPPAAGRLLVADDDQAGASPVVVVSFAFSQRYFGAAADAPGQTVQIGNAPFTVVGVTPPEFFGADPTVAPDFYVAMHGGLLIDATDKFKMNPQTLIEPNFYWLAVMGRLRPGVSRVQAEAVLAPLFHQWVEPTAANDQQRANLPRLVVREGASGLDALRRRYSKPLYMLMALVALTLLIACSNIANLQLARAAARGREIALRLSVGAGRLRIVRQLLTESILLAFTGGVVGVILAQWSLRFLTSLLENRDTAVAPQVALNGTVLGVAAGLSLLTGVLFGLAPALRSTRVDVSSALKEARTTGGSSRSRFSLSHALVVSQIAMSLLLLVAAGLFVRTLSNLHSVELGFNRENLLLFQLNARQAGHHDAELASYYRELQERFAAIPGIRGVALSHQPLFTAGTSLGMSIAGDPVRDAGVLFIGPEYFSTMQVPLVLGREFDGRNWPGSPASAVVSEQFAKTYFGDDNPLGKRLTVGADVHFEIVGVARDVRFGGLKRETPAVAYFPYDVRPLFYPLSEMNYALRTSADPLEYVNSVREVVRSVDASVPVSDIVTQTAQIDQTISQEILFARLCTAFAILALVIACVGLYGTVAYSVARRTSEIGVRMALGAKRASVVWMVLRQVLVLTAAGLAISVPTALATTKWVGTFLFGVKPNDPLAFSIAVVTLLAAAHLAAYIPARRASRIDPMIALRHE